MVKIKFRPGMYQPVQRQQQSDPGPRPPATPPDTGPSAPKTPPQSLTDTELAGAEARTLANLMSSAVQVRRDNAKAEHDAEQAALMALTVASVENRDLPRPPDAPPPKVKDVMKAEREVGEFEAGYWAGVAANSQKRSVRVLAKEIRGSVLMSGPSSKARRIAQGPQPPAEPPGRLAAAAADADADVAAARRAAARRPVKRWIDQAAQEQRMKQEGLARGKPKPPAYVPPWKRVEDELLAEEEKPPAPQRARPAAPQKRFVSVRAKKELDL